MTTYICLFGGPGSGKSTTASGLFHQMKTSGYSVELVSEFAKEVVYDGNSDLLTNQLYVFSEQFHRQFRLLNKVDWVITDSPLLLSSIYFQLYIDHSKFNQFPHQYKQSTCDYFDDSHFVFDNINVIIKRNKPFAQYGRIQTENESKEIDELILNKFKDLAYSPHIHTDSQSAVNDIYQYIKKEENVRRSIV